jgi:hypothetical protein
MASHAWRDPAAVRLACALALLVALGAACSETQSPLDWRDAVRKGLGSADSLTADTLVVREGFKHIEVPTGASGYFLVGAIDRSAGSLVSKAYMRWDLTDLPEGEIVSAHIEMHLNGVDDPVAGGTAVYDLGIYEVIDAWDEDSLNAIGPPAVRDVSLGHAQVDTVGLAAASSVLAFTLFKSEDPDEGLLAKAIEWAADDSTNYGLMLRPLADSERGFLRFFSAEGRPASSTTVLSTPLLVLEIQGDDTTTVSLEAIDDAYAMEPEGAPVTLPEGGLLVSSGYVHHSMLKLELPPPLAPATGDEAPKLAIIRGELTLSLVPDNEWSLTGDATMSVSLYDAEVDWSLADPWPETILRERLDRVTVAAGDTTVVFDMAPHLQWLLEGSGHTLVLQGDNSTDKLRSIVVQGRESGAHAPRLEIVYAQLADRLGD